MYRPLLGEMLTIQKQVSLEVFEQLRFACAFIAPYMAEDLIYPPAFRSLVNAAVAAHACVVDQGKMRSWRDFESQLGVGLDDLRKFRRKLTVQQFSVLITLGTESALMSDVWANKLQKSTPTELIASEDSAKLAKPTRRRKG
jgi:hypothetical protein